MCTARRILRRSSIASFDRIFTRKSTFSFVMAKLRTSRHMHRRGITGITLNYGPLRALHCITGTTLYYGHYWLNVGYTMYSTSCRTESSQPIKAILTQLITLLTSPGGAEVHQNLPMDPVSPFYDCIENFFLSIYFSDSRLSGVMHLTIVHCM
jgi:hypothetical protein